MSFPRGLARLESEQQRAWASNPGVGAYDDQEAYEATLGHSARPSLTGADRVPLLTAGKDNPGPGSYEQKLPVSGTTQGAVFGNEKQRPIYGKDAYLMEVMSPLMHPSAMRPLMRPSAMRPLMRPSNHSTASETPHPI